MREKITGMVLATDMTLHFEEIGKLKTRCRSGKSLILTFLRGLFSWKDGQVAYHELDCTFIRY